jgi:hypothetical protein
MAASIDRKKVRNRKPLTLNEYVRRRSGVPFGAPGSLRNMLRRSFGARSFAGFWQHWNPVFGYYLGTRVFSPLKRILPTRLALVLTFVVNGAIHDAVMIVARQGMAFFFTPWFLVLGTGVVVSNTVGMDLAQQSFTLRTLIHSTYLGSSLGLAYLLFPIT